MDRENELLAVQVEQKEIEQRSLEALKEKHTELQLAQLETQKAKDELRLTQRGNEFKDKGN